ncbi:helix-turn-helix domain-containing protein [Roseomonas haemaphysalidis]|uniref:Helix-turn-helix transcriptional regulator n=1 Tax=Roseomonas haemaphysalidis TaxID=2768162 RepID=A0ABS3KVQ0_9PROT|nr:helix-turn-helix transcriptional regulator [Roseomonas haemaphysalidis]MBO1081549.1 helix-turn-helix transcriptional regulator [Roseomonas haemaphysalidis]
MADDSASIVMPGASLVDTHVARQLRRLRVARNVTQTQLAAGLGVSTQLIHKYEVSRTRISPGRLYLCARLLNVPVSYFFDTLHTAGGPSPLPPRRPARADDWITTAAGHD